MVPPVARQATFPHLEDIPRVGEVVGGIVEEDMPQSRPDDGAEDDIDIEGIHPLLRQALTLPDTLLDHRPEDQEPEGEEEAVPADTAAEDIYDDGIDVPSDGTKHRLKGLQIGEMKD